MKIILGSLDHQLHVENFIIEYRGNQDEVMCFLPFLNPNYLKFIKLKNCEANNASMYRILNLPQVVQCNRVWVDGFPRVQMKLFWNIPRVILTKVNFSFHDISRLIQHYIQHDTFEYFSMEGVSDDWFPDDSDTFIDDKNRKSMIVKGTKFSIKIVQKREKKRLF
ncbi:hypothetical protein GCK72_017813 [Caenorhabditis remanei]|uniref:DUF38 domain-containing protein n=1 Tax=Caenorhabditis remanei TaxID=31234 RepID=A0A6A5G9W3_CAERE|nr:hypothetical protein GCK72_017813 [Caenorhabditis remanei]KAF1751259.1 hypothetical protein GCK72_017813 [Caenorhabditis remanei]